ncbi:hypothetical protein JXM83_05525 [Candidatus Woesearchaeota archaeon]|nr:hypothetical protein [Candidatus Woesearchaeota archaeon]
MLTTVLGREERISDNFVGLVKDVFGPKLKKAYFEEESSKKTVERLQNETWKIDKLNLIGMAQEYYKKRHNTTNLHLKETITPIILRYSELKGKDKLRIARKKETESIDDIVLDSIVDITDRAEVEVFANYVGLRKTNVGKNKRRKLEKKLGLRINPTNPEKVKAALYYSNTLQQYFNPQSLTQISEIEIRNSPKNNLSEVSALTGIRASTIQYWTRKIENRDDIQEFRQDTFGRRFSDLTQEDIIKIYLNKKRQGLTYEQTKDEHNLSSTYAVKQIVQYGKQNIKETLPAIKQNL